VAAVFDAGTGTRARAAALTLASVFCHFHQTHWVR
jgi:hypothetical protein